MHHHSGFHKAHIKTTDAYLPEGLKGESSSSTFTLCHKLYENVKEEQSFLQAECTM